MGILQDIGVLDSNKKLTDAQWKKFVSDVKKKLSTGTGAIPVKLDALPATAPVPGSQLLKLEDNKQFPEFETKWRQRYEDMAKSMDVDGAYGFQQKSGLPVADPTAIAVSMGSPPPQMQFSEALQSVIDPSKQPIIPLDLLKSVGDPSLTEVPPNPELPPEEQQLEKQKKEEQSIGKLLEILASQIPVPPIPVPPDPKLLELGYSEEYNQALEASLAPVLTYVDVQIPTNVLEIPKALGNIPMGLLELYAAPSVKYAPKQIEGCDFDTVVGATIEEHKIKFGALSFVGQNVGSGVLTSAIASTPFDQGGLGITDEPVEENPPLPKFYGALTQRRKNILNIIKAYLGPPPDGMVSWKKDKIKFEQLTTWNPPGWFQEKQAAESEGATAAATLKKEGLLLDQEIPSHVDSPYTVKKKISSNNIDGTSKWLVITYNGPNITQTVDEDGNKITLSGDSNLSYYQAVEETVAAGKQPSGAAAVTLVGIGDTDIKTVKMNGELKEKFWADASAEQTYRASKANATYAASQKGKDPTLTTCGSFPAYVLKKLGINTEKGEGIAKGRFPGNEPKPPLGGVNGAMQITTAPSLQGGGLESVRQAARYLGCWVDAVDEYGVWNGNYPKEGDILIFTDDYPKYAKETKKLEHEFQWNLKQDYNPCHIGIVYDMYGRWKSKDGSYEAVLWDDDPLAGDSKGNFKMPGNDRDDIDGPLWLTADAGQGAAYDGEQQASYVKRLVLVPPKDTEGKYKDKLRISGETLEKNGIRKRVRLSGWVNVDDIVISDESSSG